MNLEQQDKYRPYYELEAAGWRIGLMVCRRCGATVLIGGDGKDEAQKLHDTWHGSSDVVR